MNVLRIVPVSLVLAALPGAALAHSAGAHVDGFSAGIAHPMMGLDHLAAMLAVGMIAVRSGGPAILAIPAAFVAALLSGALLGIGGIAVPAVETGIALSLVAFGAAVALWRPLPLAAAAVLVAVFGALHGVAHGVETPVGGSGLSYAAGFVLASALLHLSGATAALALAGRTAAMRSAGLGAIAFGVATLAFGG